MKALNQKQNKQEDLSKLSKVWQRAYEKLAEPNATVQDTMFFLEAVYKDELAPKDKLYQGVLNPHEARKAIETRASKERKSLKDKLVQLQQELEISGRQNTENKHGKAADDTIAETGQKAFTVNEIEDESMPDGFKIELQYDDEAIEPPEEIQQLLASILQDFGEIPDEYLMVENTEAQIDKSLEENLDNLAPEINEDEFLYDEWDHSRQKYRKQWCHLKEVDIKPVHNNFVNNTLHKHRGLLKRLHRTFEALREDDKRMKRQPFGDDIDLDAVIEAYSDSKINLAKLIATLQ